MKMLRVLVVACSALLVTALATPAKAQLHYDVGAQAGVMKRFLAGRDTGVSDAGFGPVFQVQGHVALLPLVRVGLYATHDISPQSGAGTRQITSGGLHFRIASPWPRDPKWHLWAFAGLGYAGTYAASFHTQVAASGGAATQDAFFPGTTGSFWEIPFGIGTGYRIKRRIGLTAELGARYGFGFSSGDAYGDRPGISANQPGIVVAAGEDQLAISLSLGVSFEL